MKYYNSVKKPQTERQDGWLDYYKRLSGSKKTRLLREMLFDQQHGMCAYCGSKMVRDTTQEHLDPDEASLEHIYSRFDIRRLIRTPIAVVHYRCNQAKQELDSAFINKDYVSLPELNILDFLV